MTYPHYFIVKNKNINDINNHGLYDIVVDNKIIFPGYHMAKHKWISILLDGSVNIKDIYKLLNESFNSINNKK